MRQATPLGSNCILPGSLGKSLRSGAGEAQLVRGEWPKKHRVPVLRDPQFKVPDGMGREGWSFTPSPPLWV